MKRVFKTRHFSRWMRKTELGDGARVRSKVLATPLSPFGLSLSKALAGAGYVVRQAHHERQCPILYFAPHGALCSAVMEMSQGLIDSDLGAGLVKKRVGLAGRGKRGGARTLVATNKGNRWFFLYGFEKSDRANIATDELEALKEIATELLARTGHQLDESVEDGSLQEICRDHKD